MNVNPMIILASTSPRRKVLLSLGSWPFEIAAADVDETPIAGEPPDEYVVRLAENKSRVVGENAKNGAVIIAADTTVADGSKILGKPQDAQEAQDMLYSLRSRSHQVFTGVAVFRPEDGILLTELAVTEVPMRDYSDAEVAAYIGTGDPFDKAGAYAIQHPEFRPVELLTGCYANVVGLPLCHLSRMLGKLGIQLSRDIPAACQKELVYDCQVFDAVLKGVI